MQYGINVLWNYQGLIYDMGLEAGNNEEPCFFIMMEDWDFIQVSLNTPMNIALVRSWLDRLNTEVSCHFEDYDQFSKVIQDVFKVYADRQGKFLNYDNTFLNNMKKILQVSDKSISNQAGVGRSTVNDLTRGLTKHPKFFTVGKVHSALHKLWKEQQQN